MDGGGAQLFVFPTGRQIRGPRAASGGGSGSRPSARTRIALDPAGLFGGADLVLWNNPVRVVRGEALDEKMMRRLYLSDAGILSYRYYQLFGDSSPEFASRIVLAPRAVIHHGSMVVRKVIATGRAGVELRGGLGYDTERSVSLYNAGASAVLVPFWSNRVLVSYDLAKETATGFTGTRQTGWVTYHADFNLEIACATRRRDPGQGTGDTGGRGAEGAQPDGPSGVARGLRGGAGGGAGLFRPVMRGCTGPDRTWPGLRCCSWRRGTEPRGSACRWRSARAWSSPRRPPSARWRRSGRASTGAPTWARWSRRC